MRLVRAWLYVVGVRLSLVLFALPALKAFADRALSRRADSAPPTSLRELRRDAWAVRVASRYVPRSHTCLVQALSLQLWTARRGHETRLRIGVAPPTEDTLRAHAWLERDGVVLIGDGEDLSQYGVLEPPAHDAPAVGSPPTRRT